MALPGLDRHPHARIVLSSGLNSGSPSHAYLFHGPSGTGKAAVARAFAGELLAEGSPDPDNTRARVTSGAHPDLTWVRPTGAHVMRVDDIEEPVVGAATRTPFEAARRVFVLERVDTMNDEVANRMLKTLEEPPPFVHLILLTDSLGAVLDTVKSRCQLVRFDPIAAELLAADLERDGIEPSRARASARLAQGDGRRARYLASEEGAALRTDAEAIVLAALGQARGEGEAWRGLLERAEVAQRAVEDEAAVEEKRLAEFAVKGRDRRALERDLQESAKRDARRARTAVLELGLDLASIGFRDLCALREQAPEAVLATDRLDAMRDCADDLDPRLLREAAERCDETRSSLQQNVTEDLALEALGFRLTRLVGG